MNQGVGPFESRVLKNGGFVFGRNDAADFNVIGEVLLHLTDARSEDGIIETCLHRLPNDVAALRLKHERRFERHRTLYSRQGKQCSTSLDFGIARFYSKGEGMFD